MGLNRVYSEDVFAYDDFVRLLGYFMLFLSIPFAALLCTGLGGRAWGQ